ncbi:MAG TPA: chromosome segregation protein SMC [Thermoanaerobaculia bacterium]|nr:chromosome segregation protein SMC [Thermoanaerobaculia bacterium]
MFKLERVEIQGFKSFYEKVDLAFPGSVTAVVGPNGCGKSNICDAVAWALGEQSAKVLRGERMDDIIFNGSAKRRPLGMAEVILTLSRRISQDAETSAGAHAAGNGNGDGNGNGNGNGVVASTRSDEESDLLRIGRRVYREGHGEYFLNDKQVRLKDIQDELSGTGLGVRAYSVIEQGRIDQVLSTKPQDRRRLIEEAAGITRYKLKKRLAETKLEETRGNLLRLSDIISEIERNVASLKRQASRAARYKEKSEELRSKRAALARASHDRLSEAVLEARRETGARRDREAEASASLGRAEAELASARLSASEALGQRDRLRDLVASLESAIQRDDALLEANRRAVSDLEHRREALEREGRDVSAETERAAREIAELDERLERAVAEARNRSQSREESDRRAAAATSALAALERDLETARAEGLTASGHRIASGNARHEIDLEASRIAATLSRLQEARRKASRDMAEREEEVRRAEAEGAGAAVRSRSALQATAAVETELARIAALIGEAEATRDAAREELGAAEHRHGALSEILRGREGDVARMQSAFSRAGLSPGARLSDRLRPLPGWEDAVDLLLGSDLDALVTSGDPVAAVEASRTLPPASFVRADWTGRDDFGRTQPRAGGWETALSNFAALSPAERAALPDALFVNDLSEALALSAREPRVAVVTRSRELVRGSLVRVFHNPPEAGGLFALRRELDSLARRSSQARDSVAASDRALEDLRRSRGDLEARLPDLRERERQESALLSAIAARAEEKRAERDRLRLECETLLQEEQALSEDVNRLAAERAAREEEERRHGLEEEAARQRSEALFAALPEARSFAAAAAEDLAHRRTEAEVAAERRRSLEAARARLAESRAALDRRASEASEQDRLLRQRAEELRLEETEARERQEGNLRARELQTGELQTAAASAAEATAHAERAEESTRTARAALDVAREERFAAEMSETRVAADLEHLISQARDEFGRTPSELPAPEDAGPEALAALEAEAAELAQAIERMGPVNVLAYEEHKEMSQRLDFLSTQRDDLLRSIAELQDNIRKINATSSQRFREAFTAINENFKAMFARLFRGGAAEMRLLDENDLLESGVEIVAQPPGKRNQSILLLSGGEKALTAIALLMAIFRYKPSPFCILDEVDAPLDEANIDRFTRLLRDMTEETQFIAITHNKRTMETADIMYGVTMEEPGCSKIVSVKFD